MEARIDMLLGRCQALAHALRRELDGRDGLALDAEAFASMLPEELHRLRLALDGELDEQEAA